MDNKHKALPVFNVGQLVESFSNHGCDYDTQDYIPSIQFTEDLHQRLTNAMTNFNNVLSVYNRWKQGEAKCHWSVVNELTMATRLISGELDSISKLCQQDRAGMIYNPLSGIYGRNLATGLTPPEANELNALLDGLQPSELLQLLRHQKGVWA